MTEPITSEISDRICKHMNEDHPEAVLLYAQKLGNTPTATAARMQSIDATGMDLVTEVDNDAITVRVPFETPLADAKAAHHTLVEMLKQLRQS